MEDARRRVLSCHCISFLPTEITISFFSRQVTLVKINYKETVKALFAKKLPGTEIQTGFIVFINKSIILIAKIN
jgi:hypothetical protein